MQTYIIGDTKTVLTYILEVTLIILNRQEELRVDYLGMFQRRESVRTGMMYTRLGSLAILNHRMYIANADKATY